MGIIEHEKTDEDAKNAGIRDKIDLVHAVSIMDVNKKISQHIDRIWQKRWMNPEKEEATKTLNRLHRGKSSIAKKTGSEKSSPPDYASKNAT